MKFPTKVFKHYKRNLYNVSIILYIKLPKIKITIPKHG